MRLSRPGGAPNIRAYSRVNCERNIGITDRIRRLQFARMQSPDNRQPWNRRYGNPTTVDVSIGIPAAEIEPDITHRHSYPQNSHAFCCGGKWSEGETGAVSRARSGFSDGCLMLAGNRYVSVLHDIHRTAIGHIFRVSNGIPLYPRFN